jgi:hypothetical protein
MSLSNANQVSLKNIPLHLSGKFRCEVLTDAPFFNTKCSEDALTVLGKQIESFAIVDTFRKT